MIRIAWLKTALFLSSLPFAALAEEDFKREPAMESFGPTVVKRTLEEPEKGVLNWEVSYTGDLARNFSGGQQVGNAYLGLFDAKLHFDLNQAFGWKGTSVFLHGQATHGDDPSRLTGDAQVGSNLEAPADTAKVFEAWIQQSFADDAFSLLGGLYDLNSEFYTTETATLFLNNSFGVGKELTQGDIVGHGPSIYPTTSLAVRARGQFGPGFYAEGAVFDGVPGDPAKPTGTQVRIDPAGEGYYLISEVGWQPSPDSKSLGGNKIALGAWTYTQPTSHQSAADPDGTLTQATNNGYYGFVDHKFSDSIAAFIRYGHASDSANRFVANASAGVVFTGLIPARAADQVGLGLTRVTNSDTFRAEMDAAGTPVPLYETTLELTYKFVLCKEFSIQPDLQYVVNPNTDDTIVNAFAGFLRFRVGLAN